MALLNKQIHIVEVGPRDGLQNERTILSLETKIEFIQLLIASGLKTIEATSFVSPKWVPQMADHTDLMHKLSTTSGVMLPVLIPNQQGLENALQCHVKSIAVFAAASETFSQKNINQTITQSLAAYRSLISHAKTAGVQHIRGYVSCVLGCPYEGKVPLAKVAEVASALYEAGCEEISLGDTIGVGTPLAAKNMVKAVATHIPTAKIAVHFHDTYGQALTNIFACLEENITKIDSSVAGLGGCPYAVGASGNVATEDVVYMLEGMGYHTGIDLSKLIQASQYICAKLHIPIRSKVAIALIAKHNKANEESH